MTPNTMARMLRQVLFCPRDWAGLQGRDDLDNNRERIERRSSSTLVAYGRSAGGQIAWESH